MVYDFFEGTVFVLSRRGWGGAKTGLQWPRLHLYVERDPAFNILGVQASPHILFDDDF